VADGRCAAYDPAAMTRLNRYIFRQCFGVMIFVTAALSAAIWLAQSLRLIDLIVNRGLSIDVFLYLALLILPRFLNIVLPIGVFIAVLFTFSRLISESELVVMRSAGLSHLALAKPVLVLAGIACLTLLSLSAYFLPASNRAFKDLQFEIRSRFVSSLVQEGTFTTISDKLTIYIRSRGEQGEVVGLLINDSRNPQRQVTIVAERGAFVDSPAGARIVMRGAQAVAADIRQLHARSRHPARCPGRPLSRGARALPWRAVLSAGGRRGLLAPGVSCRGATADPRPVIRLQFFSNPARLPFARRIQPSRTVETCSSRDRARLPFRVA